MENLQVNLSNTQIPSHRHSGTDAPRISLSDIDGILLQTYIGVGTSGTLNSTTTITCGFFPKLIKITSGGITSSDGSSCFGTATSVDNSSYITFYAGSSTDCGVGNGTVINLLNNLSNTVTLGTLTSISQTGFSIRWDNVTKTCYYQYEVYG